MADLDQMRYQVTGLYHQCSLCKSGVTLFDTGDRFEQRLTITKENGHIWITPHIKTCPEWYGD